MRICTFPLSIYSILTVSSLTEIQYLLIEPSGKGTHTNQSLMLKIFYLYGFVRWTKCIWSAIENNYLLVYKLLSLQLNEFPQPEIKQKYSVQKIACINAIGDKTITKCILCIWGIVLPTSFCCSNSFCHLNSFFSLALFSPGIHNGRTKKLTNNYM